VAKWVLLYLEEEEAREIPPLPLSRIQPILLLLRLIA
jgi:hypothetical protein